MSEGAGEAAGGDSDMVLGDYLPLLRAHQLRRWGPVGQLHRLHHPIPCPHAYLSQSLSSSGKLYIIILVINIISQIYLFAFISLASFVNCMNIAIISDESCPTAEI